MISIIIPTYNRVKFLPRAISSVLNQTNDDWELIISDDGSTDDTEAVISSYLTDERIHYIKNENKGATAARNSGANIAKGDYLTFLDSDDEATENWLSAFVEFINKGAKVICCGYTYYDHNGNFIKENFPYNLGGIYLNRTGRFTNGGVFILEKNLFNIIGGYDENVKSGQHSEMALRLVQVLNKKDIDIVNIFKPLIKVHVHKGEKIRNNSEALYLGTIYTLQKHSALFEQFPDVYKDYLSIAALGAFKTNRVKESQSLFLKAWKVKPKSIKSLFRYILSLSPVLGSKVWA